MFVCVFHRDITDWHGFDELGTQLPHAPDGLQALAYFPAKDHKSALCLWRANDLGNLRKYIDGLTHGLSTNEYCEIDEKKAMGLPKLAAHA